MTQQMHDIASCMQAQTTRADVADRTVGEVMIRTPKTLPGGASIADAKQFFTNPKLISAVLLDGDIFVGLLDRTDLPSLVPDVAPVRTYCKRDVPTVTPQTPVSIAEQILDAYGTTRLVVLDDDGSTFAGLLALDRKRSGFCQG